MAAPSNKLYIGVTIAFLLFIPAGLAIYSWGASFVSLGDLRSELRSEWVTFHSSSVARRGRFTLEQKCSRPTGGVRTVYIQRDDDAASRVLYTHERGVRILLGHTGRYALIHDYFATKACNVVVAEIKTGRNWRIDKPVREAHARTASKEWASIYFTPSAVAFSPDDGQVLISLSRDLLQHKDAKPCPVWSYVVETRTGKVLREYRTDGRVPRRWWKVGSVPRTNEPRKE